MKIFGGNCYLSIYCGAMKGLVHQFIGSSRETKWFILNWTFYMFLIVATTIFCYLRLDYVRSQRLISKQIEKNENT